MILELFVADFLSEGRDSQGRLLGLHLPRVRSSIGLLRLTNTIKAWLAGRKEGRLRGCEAASEAAKERANGRGGTNGDSGRAKNETANEGRTGEGGSAKKHGVTMEEIIRVACYRLQNRTLPNQNNLYRKQVNRTLLKQESGETDSPKPWT